MERNGPRTSSTAIWNRESIIELLARELARTARDGRDLLVLLVGVDQLQSISQQYGEAQGDLVLGEVARRLNAFMRSYDHVGRYGSEQLLVLPLSYDLGDIFPLATKLREAVSHLPVDVAGTSVPVTISISLTTSAEFPSRNNHELLRELENALHRAQAEGGDRIETVRAVRSASRVSPPARERIRVGLIVSVVLLVAVVALLWISPVWSCAPFRLRDVLEAGELPPPLPTDCAPTSETLSDATMQSLDRQRENGGLLLQETITCKIPAARKSRGEGTRDQQWLSALYVNGVYQYRRHVFLAASQDVRGGTLFTVEICLMPWWDYMKQPGDACWGQYAFWR